MLTQNFQSLVRVQFLTEQGVSGFEVFEDNLKHCL